jgi:hypothetical protein
VMVRAIGWLGMIGVCVWLVWRGVNDVPVAKPVRSESDIVSGGVRRVGTGGC